MLNLKITQQLEIIANKKQQYQCFINSCTLFHATNFMYHKHLYDTCLPTLYLFQLIQEKPQFFYLESSDMV